jgi:hypothetical protein
VAVGVALCWFSSTTQAQTITRNGDGVTAMFASQSEAYKDSVLALTGQMWIAGDPFDLHVATAVPEPSSMIVLCCGVAWLLACRRA